MALTPDDPHRRPAEPGSRQGDQQPLARLAEAVRAAGDHGWARVSRRVLDRVFAATPGSWPVHAAAPGGPVNVSERVLIAYLRAAVAQTPGATVRTITTVLDEDRLTGLTVVIGAQYGLPLVPLADAVRRRVADRLTDLLGPVDPPVGPHMVHVHVADIVPAARPRELPRR